MNVKWVLSSELGTSSSAKGKWLIAFISLFLLFTSKVPSCFKVNQICLLWHSVNRLWAIHFISLWARLSALQCC